MAQPKQARAARYRKHSQPPSAVALPPRRIFGPTEEFEQHHGVAKPDISRKRFREAWSVQSRFLKLNPSDATITAADRWRADFDLAQGVREGRSLERVDGDNGTTDGIGSSQIDAEARLRAVRDDIGRTYSSLLLWCLVLDQEWRITAQKLGCEYRYAQTMTEQALAALGKHYQALDNRRKVR